ERFGYADPTRGIELVVARVKARVRGQSSIEAGAAPAKSAQAASKAIVVWDRARRTRIVPRAAVGRRGIVGPAILTQLDTTTLVPPGWRARPAEGGHLILSPIR
ncbi:MAG: hypothetical protein O7A71_01125, partial [Chloroflexi bacterium]|nr:hypothetical protein [Chloroflexota bacterium]